MKAKIDVNEIEVIDAEIVSIIPKECESSGMLCVPIDFFSNVNQCSVCGKLL